MGRRLGDWGRGKEGEGRRRGRRDNTPHYPTVKRDAKGAHEHVQ